MDNLTEAERRRRQLIQQIQFFYKKDIFICEIIWNIGKNCKKYLHGNSNLLCRSILDKYTDFIIKSIQSGLTQYAVARKLACLGYTRGRAFICKVVVANNLEFRKYSNGLSKYNDDGSKKAIFIT